MPNVSTNLKSWGSSGSEYPDNYNYLEGEQPVDEWDNFFQDETISVVNSLITAVNDELLAADGTVSVDNNTVALTYPDDAGAETIADLGVTSTPGAGTEESLGIDIDGTGVVKAFAESDGAGGIQNRQVLAVTTGSAARPAIGFDTDRDTGLYRDSADDIRVVTNGTYRIAANASGVFVDNGDFYVNGNNLRRVGGSTDASTGAVRMANDISMYARNSGDSGDFGFSFTASDTIQVDSANLDLNSNDLVDGATQIWDNTNNHLEQSALENDSVTVAGQSVALGNSTSIPHSAISSQSADDHHAKTTSQTDLTDFSFAGENIFVQSTEPSSPSTNDIWVDTS